MRNLIRLSQAPRHSHAEIIKVGVKLPRDEIQIPVQSPKSYRFEVKRSYRPESNPRETNEKSNINIKPS
jgi:hypothetical protein